MGEKLFYLTKSFLRQSVFLEFLFCKSPPSGRRDPTRAENFSSVRDKSANSLNGLMKFLLQVREAEGIFLVAGPRT